jgi:triacylglycerol lipase
MRFVAWLSVTLASGDPAPLPPDPAKAPVVLIHGIDGSASDMSRLAKALRASGRQVFTPSLVPNDGTATIEELSAQLESFVAAEVPRQPFDLIGYSMGGIVARHYLQARAGGQRVRRFVSLSAPHHGTLGAFLRRSPGAKQMRLASDFIQQLNQTEPAVAAPTTSFWTPTDLIILPPSSSCLPHATNVRVIGLGHFSCIIEKRCIDQVVACLE